MSTQPPPFSAYKGSEPYVFICYAHADSAEVFRQLQLLREAGINIWYDEGISAGSLWRAEIANALEGASHVLFFASPASVASQHCNSELNFAFDQDIPVLPVYLAATELTQDLKIGLSRVQAIHFEDPTQEHKLRELIEASQRMTTRRKPARGYKTVATWLGVIAVLAGLALLTVYLQPGGPATTADNTSRETVVEAEAGDNDPAEVLPATSIAILPFKDLNPDDEHQWLIDSLQMSMIDALSRTNEFYLPGHRNMSGLDASTDLEEIARSLKVGTVVEGSLAVQGDDLRITVQIISATDGKRMWSGRFNRTTDDLFALQDEISTRIAETIRQELGMEDPRSSLRLARYDTEDIRAYELLVKAGAYLESLGNFMNQQKREEAMLLLDEALSLDPDYASALAAKSMLLVWNSRAVDVRGNDSEGAEHLLEQARSYANRALETGEVATAYQALAEIAFDNQDWDEAIGLYEKAIALEPWNGDLHMFYQFFMLTVFRFDDALHHAERAAQLDPRLPAAQMNLAMVNMHLGNYEQAIRHAQRALDMGDNSWSTHALTATALYLLGREPEAAESQLTMYLSNPLLQARMNRDPSIRENLEAGNMTATVKRPLDIEACRSSMFLANARALWHAVFEDKEAMLTCLEVARPHPGHINLFDHRYKPYWYEPRFIALLERVGLADYLPAQDTLR